MLNPVTYDIPFSFEQPDYTLRALLGPVRQKLSQSPASLNPHEPAVRNGLTILIIDAQHERAQYIANLLITVGYRPVVTANALAAFTLFLQGTCLPLAVILGQADGSNRLFLLRLLQQLEQKYGWQAPLLRLLASSRPASISGPLLQKSRDPMPPPIVPYTPAESLTPPPLSYVSAEPSPPVAPAILPVHTRLSVRDKNSSASFPPLSPVPSGPLSQTPDPISEPLDPLPSSQLEFADHGSIPLPESMLAALPQLDFATQIPTLPASEPLQPVPAQNMVPQIEQHAQDAEEMLARIDAYRRTRISLDGQTVVIRYQVRRLLGGGAHSDVYLTYDRFREQECALKAIQTDLLPAHLLQSSLESVTLFQQEIELLNTIKHPHILPVLNSGKSYISSSPFIYKSMPYCAEGSLIGWMQRHSNQGLYSLENILPIALQLADALQYAHAAHIIYQNFKQSNIFVLRSAKRIDMLDIALADFSTLQDAPLPPMSPESLLYIAPERWEGVVLPASDQYGLAAVIYELLTGRPPYQGISERILKLLHTTRLPQPVHTLNRKLSPQVDDVLMRALAKRPTDRFESIAQFAQALEHCR